MTKIWPLVLLAVVFCAQISQQATVILPVPQDVLTNVTLSINELQNVLKYFGTWYENKWAISKRVELTKKYLQELSNCLAQYNNVIVGTGNTVNGSKNFVIGNYDNIEGSNNWVFVSQFTGKINGDLLVGNWRVQLDKSKYIIWSPRFAISFLNEEKNLPLKTKYAVKRQLCKWDKWTHPEHEVTDSHWKRYSGYSDWKTNYWGNLRTTTTTTTTSGTGTWGSWGSWGSGWGW